MTRWTKYIVAVSALILPLTAMSLDELLRDDPQRTEILVNLYTGEPVVFEDMMDNFSEVDILYLGERHGVARHHHLQHKVVAALLERGKPLVVGLEMMQKSFQPALDRYVSGELDFEALAAETAWATHWRNYQDYKSILESARQGGAQLLALNAETDLIRKIGREGLASLTDEERERLPEGINLDDAAYYELQKLQLMVHRHVSEENLQNMFAAQVARDETMAETMARYLLSPKGQGRQAVVLCGAGHCAFGYGTVARVRHRLPEAEDRILIMSASGDVHLSEAMQRHMRPIVITHQQRRAIIHTPLADYLSVIAPAVTDDND